MIDSIYYLCNFFGTFPNVDQGHSSLNKERQSKMTFDNLQQVDGQTACQVTMTVDGQYPEKWRTIGQFSYLSSSSMFLGGSDGRENVPLLKHINNLVGCLKKVSTKETCTLQLCNIDSLNFKKS